MGVSISRPSSVLVGTTMHVSCSGSGLALPDGSAGWVITWNNVETKTGSTTVSGGSASWSANFTVPLDGQGGTIGASIGGVDGNEVSGPTIKFQPILIASFGASAKYLGVTNSGSNIDCEVGNPVNFSWYIQAPGGGGTITEVKFGPFQGPVPVYKTMSNDASGSTSTDSSIYVQNASKTWTLMVKGSDGSTHQQSVTVNYKITELWPTNSSNFQRSIHALTSADIPVSGGWTLRAWDLNNGIRGFNPSGGPISVSNSGGSPLTFSMNGYSVNGSIVGSSTLGSTIHVSVNGIPWTNNNGEPGGTSWKPKLTATQDGHNWDAYFEANIQGPTNNFVLNLQNKTDVALNATIKVGSAGEPTGWAEGSIPYDVAVTGDGTPYINGYGTSTRVTAPNKVDIYATAPSTYDTTIYFTGTASRVRNFGSGNTLWNSKVLTDTGSITTEEDPAIRPPTFDGFTNLSGLSPLTQYYDPQTIPGVQFTSFTGTRKIKIECLNDSNTGGPAPSAIQGWLVNGDTFSAGPEIYVSPHTRLNASLVSAAYNDNPSVNATRTFKITAYRVDGYAGPKSPKTTTFTLTTGLPDVIPDLPQPWQLLDANPGRVVDSAPIIIDGLSDTATTYAKITGGAGTPLLVRTRGGTTVSGQTLGLQNGDVLVLRVLSHATYLNSYTYSVSFGLSPSYTSTSKTSTVSFLVKTRAIDLIPDDFTVPNITDADPSSDVRTPTAGPVKIAGFDGNLHLWVDKGGATPSPASQPYVNVVQNYSLTGSNLVTISDPIDPAPNLIQIQVRASSVFNTTESYVIKIGSYPSSPVIIKQFSVKTRLPNYTIDTIVFDDTHDLIPAQEITSNTLTLVGFDTTTSGVDYIESVSHTIESDDVYATFSVNGAPFVSGPVSVSKNDTLAIKTIAPLGFYQTKVVGLIGNNTQPGSTPYQFGTWEVRTKVCDDLTLMAEY